MKPGPAGTSTRTAAADSSVHEERNESMAQDDVPRQAKGVPLPGLRALRRRRGLSQRELAELAGTTQGTVWRLETGRRGAYFRTIKRLSAGPSEWPPMICLVEAAPSSRKGPPIARRAPRIPAPKRLWEAAEKGKSLYKINCRPEDPHKPRGSLRGLSSPHTGPHEGQVRREGDVPPTARPNSKAADVSSAVGGALSTLSFEEGIPGDLPSPRPRRGGGPRGTVRNFSRASRLRLLRRQAQIDRTAVRASKVKSFFATCDYGETWPEDPAVWKAHLKALYKRLRRKFGEFAGFWRLGVQRRGAPHFHLLLYAPPSFGKLKEVRAFVATAWHEIVGDVSEGHLRAGTCVDQLRTWKSMDRGGRYIAKEEEFPAGVATGRTWGVWGKDMLPVRWETVRVGLEDGFRIRRIFRKLAGKRGTGPLRRLTIFVRYQNVVRLLDFLGYPLEER